MSGHSKFVKDFINYLRLTNSHPSKTEYYDQNHYTYCVPTWKKVVAEKNAKLILEIDVSQAATYWHFNHFSLNHENFISNYIFNMFTMY